MDVKDAQTSAPPGLIHQSRARFGSHSHSRPRSRVHCVRVQPGKRGHLSRLPPHRHHHLLLHLLRRPLSGSRVGAA